MNNHIKFVSYDGSYPCLCAGTLVLNIDGKNVQLPPYCLTSGGCVTFNDSWDEDVEKGPWHVDVPTEYIAYADEIRKVVNNNIPWGCCGGCV